MTRNLGLSSSPNIVKHKTSFLLDKRNFRTLASIAIYFLLLLPACATPPDRPKFAVQIQTIGDDGLTQKFTDEMRASISKSDEFSLASGNSYAFRMLIAGNFFWSQTERGLSFNVVVVITDSQERFLDVHTGTCWENDMRSCADRVLIRAAKQAHNHPENKVMVF